MHVLYRMSSIPAGIKKNKLQGLDKYLSFKNALESFPNAKFTVIGDSLTEKQNKFIAYHDVDLIRLESKSSAESFLKAVEVAFRDKVFDNFYFLEDDFLHQCGSDRVLASGLRKFSGYITLYDHPDKYTNKQASGVLKENRCQLFAGEICHWRSAVSTVMTFAVKRETLEQDWRIIKKTLSGRGTQSHRMFRLLGLLKGRRVFSAIPGCATHCETAYLGPLFDWGKLLAETRRGLLEKEVRFLSD